MREFGSEQPAIVIPDGYFEGLKQYYREITYLRCGREALLYVSCNCKKGKDDTILMPSYCCWSMSAPFEKSGWRIIYYRLNEDLTINEEYLKELLMLNKPQAILTMNYYGSAPTKNAIHIVNEFNKDIVVIEDFSHCTFCLGQIFNTNVDYYVSSIRKQIGISDGAIVLSKKATNRHYIDGAKPDFCNIRFVSQIDKGRYSYYKDLNKKNSFIRSLRGCEDLIDNFNSVHPISDIGLQQLTLINGKEIAYARRENMKHLWTLLNGKIKMVPGLERGFDGAPFALPILVNNQLEVQKTLAKEGVYTQVLWPICETAQKVCQVAKNMSERMLSVPIDQRYDWDDIEEIARIILETVC